MTVTLGRTSSPWRRGSNVIGTSYVAPSCRDGQTRDSDEQQTDLRKEFTPLAAADEPVGDRDDGDVDIEAHLELCLLRRLAAQAPVEGRLDRERRVDRLAGIEVAVFAAFCRRFR